MQKKLCCQCQLSVFWFFLNLLINFLNFQKKNAIPCRGLHRLTWQWNCSLGSFWLLVWRTNKPLEPQVIIQITCVQFYGSHSPVTSAFMFGKLHGACHRSFTGAYKLFWRHRICGVLFCLFTDSSVLKGSALNFQATLIMTVRNFC